MDDLPPTLWEAELPAPYMRKTRHEALPSTAANEIVATNIPTEPPTIVAERGDSTSLIFLVPAASGAKYVGRNETPWEHHGEAIVTRGYGAPPERAETLAITGV